MMQCPPHVPRQSQPVTRLLFAMRNQADTAKLAAVPLRARKADNKLMKFKSSYAECIAMSAADQLLQH